MEPSKQHTATAPIYVAGHRGMVGSAIVRHLQALGQEPILTATHAELDLTNQAVLRRSIWPPPKWAVSTPTTPIRPSSFTKT
jgi:nucleoside-diphosphate-sugar epimerase